MAGEGSRHWRGRYWRDQARTALGLTVLVGIVLAFAARDLGFILIASAAVAFPIWLVTESWLALGPQEPDAPLHGFWRGRLAGALPVIVGFAIGMSFYRERLEWQVLLILAPMLTGVAVRALYAWRDAKSRPIGLLTASFARISYDGACAHFASYAIALAAGVAAAAQFDDMLPRAVAYACAVLLGKLAADFVFTKPAPLDDRTLSGALMRMTVLSPLWWGVPWGAFAAGFFFAFRPNFKGPVAALILDVLPILCHVAIAVVFVLAAVTAVAYFRTSHADKAWDASRAEEERALRPADWARLYAGVLALALTGYALVFVPFWRSDEDYFGVETWTCARVDDRWTLGWLAKDGIEIKVHDYIDLSDISCVPQKDGRGCEYDEDGWEEIEIVVHGKDGFRTSVVFNRQSEGVRADLRHHAYVFGELGNEILWALYNGAFAELKVKAPGGRLLYTRRIDLTGYNNAFKACIARWREERAP
jgi:hypothetical protein